ncbi:unnamed protein product [Rotaria sp. Silwood1]|nr:unnamed protein product [Rotaria sp. Silwood1]CAF3732845.1 unnamed protein product [Rotaria sp. Silwood1]CAF3784908.1 unnamed protein product [Rotaria sp. Silwood1]CAF4640670.1 unnamed protein product [Rotaria sp. Silwood1]CAF4702061.1 unnamed protein product [Rotaria sp. Silwood1]
MASSDSWLPLKSLQTILMTRTSFKVNEEHLLNLAIKARLENRECGYLSRRGGQDPSSSPNKWQLKWFVLYQNLLFYYENVNSTKPQGVYFLESCYSTRSPTKNSKDGEKLNCFSISYTRDGRNAIEFAAESETDCQVWIECIQSCSYNRLLSVKEELEQKYLHLSQVYESEAKAKYQYLQQVEELSTEVRQLRSELSRYRRQHHLLRTKSIAEEDTEEIRKIKKVQSLCRGWLYRQRWKRIVEEYIRSPHAELIRRRNNIVFNLVESEREYVHQLEILVANYVRPFRMAASSKKPPITHEDVNSIFLNTEIILFLHQIFYKGLSKKLENWPTFYTGDLFDMLISMLHIYLEYVRNHHYSLQCLVECKLSNPGFNKFLERCEMKAACEGLTLDILLVLPMNRIPYYIVTLANCLSHTPHAHVEREKLEQTKSKLEELSKIMHDEVSETEHIRTNLAIERSIAEGCDVLLDVNQVLCRQDSLMLWIGDRNKLSLGQRFTTRDYRRNEIVVQCYLFSNHLVITTRASSGKLHLVKGCGVIPLADVTLVEDITSDPQYLLASVIEEDSIDNTNSNITDNTTTELDLHINRLFRLIVESRNQTPYSTTLVANDEKHKSEWCTDIAQCLQNLRYTQLVTGTFRNASSVMAPESVKSDVKLYKDDAEIKYSKTLDSCKIPQIRHATVERLLERLTDLRFLSIDFLNTFLLTYRLYTDAYTVMETLIRVYKSSPHTSLDHTVEIDGTNSNTIQKIDEQQKDKKLRLINEHDNEFNRRVSEGAKLLTTNSITEQERDLRRHSHIGTFHRELSIDHHESIKTARTQEKKLSIKNSEKSVGLPTSSSMDITASIDRLNFTQAPLASSETFSDVVSICRDEQQKKYLSTNNGISNNIDKNSSQITKDNDFNSLEILFDFPSVNIINDSQTDIIRTPENHCRVQYSENTHMNNTIKEERKSLRFQTSDSPPTQKQRLHLDTQSATTSQNVQLLSKRLSEVLSSPRQSIRNAAESSFKKVLPGVVVTSSRSSRRRISSAAATQAFAVATSGESPKSMRNERLASNQGGGSISMQTATTSNSAMPLSSREQRANEYIIVNTASTMRVLNVLRHWLTKHPLDFHTNPKLKEMVLELLQDMLFNNHLIAAEHKAAVAIIKQLETAEIDEKKEQLCLLLYPKQISNATFDQIAVSDLAEQMTLIDHKLFCALGSEELLLQGWMKPGRDDLAPNVALVSRRFNEMCRLVITEILEQPTINARIQCIEKWCTVADICRYLRNFNGVLQIMAAFVNSSVYRLKQTWDRISKQNKQVINKLQNLVHSDGKFKNLRDTLTKVDPPCVPYLGLYLSDLTFIEESSQDISENLINFSKMRMKTHIINEVHRFQSTPFKIKHNPRVCAYLLDRSRLLTEDQCYLLSLKLEPRTSRVGLTGFGV